MTAERVAALTVFILPAVVALCAGLWKVFLWAVDRHDRRPPEPTEPRVQQGQVIEAAVAPWADRAYEGIVRELKDEQADHAQTINRHRSCHDAMRDAGLSVPDDH